MRELLAFFGLEFDTGGIEGAFTAISNLTDQVFELADTLTDNLVVNAISDFVGHVSEAAFEVRNIAEQIDESTDQVQEWGFLFGQVGLELDDVGDVLATLQERARDARESDDVAGMFRSIGVATTDANGDLLDANTLFRETVAGFSRMENASDQAGLALTLFGDSGRRLLPILREGVTRLDESSAEFQRLGGGLSTETIGAVLNLQIAGERLSVVLESLGSNVAEVLIPPIAQAVDVIAEVVNGFREFTEGTNLVEGALAALAVVAAVWATNVLIGFAPVIAGFLLITTVVAVLALLFDDLITLWEGGDSVIGDLLDSLFGIGTSVQVVENIRQAWDDFSSFFGSIIDGTSTVWADFVRALEFTLGPSLDAIGEAWDGLTGRLSRAWQETVDFWSGLWNGFVETVQGGINFVVGGAAELADTLGLEDLAGSIRDFQVGTPPGMEPTPAGGGSTTVTNNMRQDVTVTATGADPGEVARMVRDGIQDSQQSMVRGLADQSSRRR